MSDRLHATASADIGHGARPRVVVTRALPQPVQARMAELFDVRLNVDDVPMDDAALVAAMADADVLAPTVTDRIHADLIAAAGPRLKLIANFGVGVDHIDVAAAAARGITVTNTPRVLTDDTADMAMALILAGPRRIFEGAQVLQRGGFQGWSPTWMMGRRVHGKRLAIIGMGRIGQAVAARAQAFGMAIHYHNRRPVSPMIEEALDATYWDDLDALLATADIVTIHTPRTPATYHLFSRERLTRLQPHAFLVNTSRGDVIDEDALGDALAQGRLAGAALDVFEAEPAVSPKLLGRPNVILIPHMSSATLESRVEMGEKVIINIRVWQDGERPPDRILPEETSGALI